MNDSLNTVDRVCNICGKPLKQIEVTLFGKPHQVSCYGSCDCEQSAEKLESYGMSYSQPSKHRCPVCGGSMMITDYVSDCPQCGYTCVFKSDQEEVASEKAEQRAKRLGSILANTGVPRLYWTVQPDYELAEKIIAGKGLFITGGNGTYKTLKAASIAKAFAELHKSVRFASSVKLLSDFKSTYGTKHTEQEVFSELMGCDLLIIDDMGKENPTSWASAMLFQVIDGRYGENKPVVVTTNYTENELATRLAGSFDESTARAIVSRLFEMTEHVSLDGPDRRLA